MLAEQMSGLYYPNRIARVYLQAMEDVMGINGLNAVLNLVGLSKYIGHYPPDNLKKEFDFAEFTALNLGLEEMYGPRGGRGLALRAGRACFSQGLRNFGALAGVNDIAFKALPLRTKLKMGLPAMAAIFSQFSDQKSDVQETDEYFHFYIRDVCPICYKRSAERPVGHTMVGLLQETLRWISGGHEFRVLETTCIASGAPHGVFMIYKDPIG